MNSDPLSPQGSLETYVLFETSKGNERTNTVRRGKDYHSSELQWRGAVDGWVIKRRNSTGVLPVFLWISRK